MSAFQVIVADNAGFCFGVKRAIETVEAAARESQEGLCTLGPLIHNPQVVERLKALSIFPADSLSTVTTSRVAIPAQGVPLSVAEEIQRLGLRVVDATCPFVRAAQERAALLHREGYQVVLVGDAGHSEVKAIVGSIGSEAVVIGDADELTETKLSQKVGVIVQTTQTAENYLTVLGTVAARAREVRAFNTICQATTDRQQSALELARRVNLMVVIGGRMSANTNRLREICEQTGVPTHHVETADEIDPAWLKNVSKVGITAGASTPQWIIDQVAESVKKLRHQQT